MARNNFVFAFDIALITIALVLGAVAYDAGNQVRESRAAFSLFPNGGGEPPENPPEDPVPPEVTLGASPAYIDFGESSDLLWTSSHADTLTVDNGIGGVVTPNGTMTVSPSMTTTYTITATNDAGTSTDSTIVSVGEGVPEGGVPDVSISVSPSTIESGQSATLSWTSSDADILIIDNDIGSVIVPSGTVSVNPTSTTTYAITAENEHGTIGDSVTLTVGNVRLPSIDISASRINITKGESVLLFWTSADADTVSFDNGIGIVEGAEGSVTVTPDETTTYTATATNGEGTADDSLTVYVSTLQKPAVFLSVDTASIISGQSAVLSWSSERADSLSISPDIGPVAKPDGTYSVSPFGNTTYVITATNGAGTSTDSQTVSVTVPEPSVSLSADAQTIFEGDSVLLNWTSSWADVRTLNPGNIPLNSESGSISVTPASSVTYTVVAESGVGVASDSVAITVNPVETEDEGEEGREEEEDGGEEGNGDGSGDERSEGDGAAGLEDETEPEDMYESVALPATDIPIIEPIAESIPETGRTVELATSDGVSVEQVRKEIEAEERKTQKIEIVYGIKVSKALEEAPVVKTLKRIEEVRRRPEVKNITYAAAVPAAVAVSTAAASATVSATSTASLWLYFQAVIGQIFTAMGRKRNKNKGQVVNSLTHEPVALAIVRLYDNATNRLLQTKVTDNLGQYQFIVHAGTYRIEIHKEGFDFPSTISDESDNYNIISVSTEKAVIKAQLPADPSAELSSLSATRLVLIKTKNKLKKAFVFGGLILSVASVVIQPSVFTFAVLGIQSVLVGVVIMYQGRKTTTQRTARVTNESKQPVRKAVVRLLDPKYKRMLAYEVTDGNGGYGFLISGDMREFEVTAEKAGYKTAILEKVVVPEDKTYVAENVILPSVKEAKQADTSSRKMEKTVHVPDINLNKNQKK